VRSTDGGATFSPVIDIDTDGSIGRVETLLLPSGDAIILWYDLVGKDGIIAMKRLAPDGTLGALQTLAKISVERSSGSPARRWSARISGSLAPRAATDRYAASRFFVYRWNRCGDGGEWGASGLRVVRIVPVPCRHVPCR